MATISAKPTSVSPERFEGLDGEALIRAFRIMHLARRLDDREVTLKRQNRIYFQISGAGHDLRGWREAPGFRRIGLGECRGVITPAIH